MTTCLMIVLSFIALVAASISIVRFMPSPERSPHAFDGQFHVTHDKDAQQLRILAANEDRLIVEETQGSHCEPDVFLDDGCAPPYHYHTSQYETFEVMEGAVRIKLNGDESTVLQKGEKFTVAPRDKHTLIKSGHEDMRVRVILFPNPDHMERFFPNLFGTIRDGGPNPVQILYVFCNNGVRIADMPSFLHETLCVMINVMAPLAGYHLEYPEYAFKGDYQWNKSEEGTETPLQKQDL